MKVLPVRLVPLLRLQNRIVPEGRPRVYFVIEEQALTLVKGPRDTVSTTMQVVIVTYRQTRLPYLLGGEICNTPGNRLTSETLFRHNVSQIALLQVRVLFARAI